MAQVCSSLNFLFSKCYLWPSFTPSIQLQKGANDARSDDVRRIKEELALWLNSAHAPSPPFNTKCRSDRGMENDITGRLLCPIEYDWDDEPSVSSCDFFLRVPEHFSLVFVMESARGTINISEDYFLRCFYPYGTGDPDNVEKGFLRSGLLVKVCFVVFIPSMH